MKKKSFRFLFAALLLALTMCAAVCFAEPAVFTQHKVILSYDKQTNTIDADIYISKGTAIVGYCSFTYDSSVLELIDVNGSSVTAGNVPSFSQDGSIYLDDVVTAHNGVVITDIGKGTPTLINPEEGYFMFAWFLPGSIPNINANEGVEPLIASVRFKLIDDITYEDFDKDTFWVADSEITDKISGWYPGIVVMNDKQQQFNFDGTVEDGDLFLLEYELDGLGGYEKPNKPDVKPDDEPVVEPDDEPVVEPDDEPVVEPDDEPVVEPDDEPVVEPDDEPVVEPDDEPVVEPDDEPVVEPDDEPSQNDDDKKEPVSVLPESTAFKADFKLEITKTNSTVNISWEKPAVMKKVDNYAAVLCDGNYNVIKEVVIFNAGASYTFKNLRDDFDYILYFYGIDGESTYCSDAYSIKTDTSDEPSPIVFTVTYDAGKGSLYGLKSEDVLFGGVLTKVPSVTAPSGKYFIGWSENGKDLYNTSLPVYSSLKLTALYSDKAPVKAYSYITGYTDGTFKPEGFITRAEAASLIARLSPEFNSSQSYCHSFSDCTKDAWYEKAVAFCSSKGFITGYTDGTFNPSGNITRAEFAAILVRVFSFDEANSVNVFSDMDGHWACPYTSRLFASHIVTPDEDGKFRPSEKLTRKDAVMMLNKCLGINPDIDGINGYLDKNGYKFTDIEQYKDYFYPIMAATLKDEDYKK